MPTVELRPAQRGQLTLLNRLMQLYCHDFDDYLQEGVDERGLYDVGFNMRRYFSKAGYWAYIGYVDDAVAGFSLISDRTDHGTGHYIDEFFVLRTYRRQGVGRELARQTFAAHPGYWEVVALGPNWPAVEFWRAVIDEVTKGDYHSFVTVEGSMEHVWFTFSGGA